MKKSMLIKNIGMILTGDIDNPVSTADTILVENGQISRIGSPINTSDEEISVTVDAKGLTVCPGLIDAHTHPPVADYLSSFKAVDWAENYMAGGITSMVSVGGIRFPGAPSTVSGAKALAVLSKQVWENHRPYSSKVHAGTLMLVKGLKEEDFKELAKENVSVIGEVGMSEIKDPWEAAELVKVAHSCGCKVTVHSGGASSMDCASYTAEDIFRINPDVVCHLNGAPTPMSADDIRLIIEKGNFYYDVVSSGNVRALLDIVKWSTEENKLDKMMLGTNAPSMAGYSPMGLWTLMATICSAYSEFDPAKAVALATGNVAKCYNLDHGLIKDGYKADFLFCDAAFPEKDIFGTLKIGNVPSVAMIVMDGNVGMTRCKNTPAPSRRPDVGRGQ